MRDFSLDQLYYFAKSDCLHGSREKSERCDATHATSKFLAASVHWNGTAKKGKRWIVLQIHGV